jgi:hypothetical protein
VKSQILAKVLEFCKHYNEEPMNEIEKPLKSANMGEVVQEWYATYVDVEQEVLFELILAANYMDIKPLLDLTCATVASMIKGKTPEEIRKTFNIVNDFTPEEEAQGTRRRALSVVVECSTCARPLVKAHAWRAFHTCSALSQGPTAPLVFQAHSIHTKQFVTKHALFYNSQNCNVFACPPVSVCSTRGEQMVRGGLKNSRFCSSETRLSLSDPNCALG